MSYRHDNASSFAQHVKGLGFHVYLAKAGDYGFITDEAGSRVLTFSFSGTDGGSLSGNYGPPSQSSGTGWCLEQAPHELVTAEDVRRALNEAAPRWCGNGWKHYTTLAQYMKLYGDSSRFAQV